MKYLLLALLLFSCDAKDRCEFGNGSRAFLGTPTLQCPTEQKPAPRTLTPESEKGHPKYLTPGRFKIVDKKDPYYNCTGIIEGGPFFDEDQGWRYYFSTMKCGDFKPTSLTMFFQEKQLNRTGNLAD